MDKVFFSIVLPTYNRANMLSKAINSVLCQSYTNWELIVVDDGSTDNTQQVVAQFEDSRIKYIYQENQERSAARNNGIRNATGKYICFIDSDDEYLPNHLKALYNSILNTGGKKAVYYSELCINNENNKNKYILKKEASLLDNIFEHALIPRICVKKEILLEFPFNENLNISEDTELLVRILNKYPKIVSTNEHTVLYKIHEDNSVNYKKYNAYAKRKEVLQQILQNSNSNVIRKSWCKKIINQCNFGIIKYYYYQGKKTKAISTTIKSIIELPNYKTKEKIVIFTKLLLNKKVWD